MSSSDAVKHVSDTALWVANYRAKESERADAVFKDTLAARLVGDRGRAIAAKMPYGRLIEWVLVVRTSAIDRLIHHAIEGGADTVMNLGAGLDTRPYRMDLPASLRWVEVDFPEMIRYKNDILADERPVCQLERVAADLSDRAARRAVIAKVGAEARRVVVLSEGVIPYLPPEEVALLSDDLLSEPSIDCWIQDYRQGGRATALKKLRKVLKDAPFRFAVKDWLGFFAKRGWKVGEIIYAYHESKRIGRRTPFVFPLSLVYLAKFLVSRKQREKTIRQNGYVMFERALRPSAP